MGDKKTIKCPHCGTEITVNRTGRKPKDISLNIIYEALQSCIESDVPLWSGTARLINKISGIEVSPAFVQNRTRSVAAEKGLSVNSLLKNIGNGRYEKYIEKMEGRGIKYND